jgi:hypothetical protein
MIAQIFSIGIDCTEYQTFRGEKTCFKDKERPGTKAEGLNLLKSKGKYIIRIKEECRQN